MRWTVGGIATASALAWWRPDAARLYGRTPVIPADESVRPTPEDPAAPRLALGDQLRIAAAAGGPEATVPRFITLYGPGTASWAVPTCIQAGLAGRPATIAGDGQELRTNRTWRTPRTWCCARWRRRTRCGTP